MSHSDKMSGVLSPVITPFKDNLEPVSEKLFNHCRWLLDNNVRPPLDPFDDAQTRTLITSLEALGFSMNGLEK